MENEIKIDFYLQLPSEADMPTILSDFYKQDYTTVVDEVTGEETQTPEGEPYLVPFTSDYAIDVVGKINKSTGVILTDAEGNEYPEMAPVTGWHVNLRLTGDKMRSIADDLDAGYGVAPATPYRVWA